MCVRTGFPFVSGQPAEYPFGAALAEEIFEFRVRFILRCLQEERCSGIYRAFARLSPTV